MSDQEIIYAVQDLQSKEDLLDLLNDVRRLRFGRSYMYFKMSQLNYYCNPNKRRANTYSTFEIPKKSGGTRKISSPCPSLMAMQECLNEVFKVIYEPSDVVMGFVPRRSIISNAAKHVNKNYVFNIDLKDFFTSIHQPRVWKVLQLPPFSFNRTIASAIAGLCCQKDESSNGVLPQGAPTSPVLTNLVCRNLDRRLCGLARKYGLTYTRYADDITFSSLHNIYDEGGSFRRELSRIIKDQGFAINDKKTRLQCKGERQDVTGLVVNEKVNVTRQFVRDLQCILFIWERHGYRDACTRFFRKYNADKAHTRINLKLEDVVRGRLQFLKQVKGASDPVYKKLYSRFRKLNKGRKYEWSSENLHYILWYRVLEFEKTFKTRIVFKYKPETVVIPGVSKSAAYCELFGEHTMISVPKAQDEFICKYIDTHDREMRQVIRTSYYVTLAQRGNDKFWILMKHQPYNGHKRRYTQYGCAYDNNGKDLNVRIEE